MKSISPKPASATPPAGTDVVLGPGVLPIDNAHNLPKVIPLQSPASSSQLVSVANAAPPVSTPAPAPARISGPASDSFGHVAGYNDVPLNSPKIWVPAQSTAAPLPPTTTAKEMVLASPLPVPSGPAIKPVTKPTPAPTDQASKVSELMVQIRKAGGNEMSRLQVSLKGNKLAVRFSAPSRQEAQRLAQIMMTLPALAPYWLELKVDVPN
jgi:hypothetical protein